MNSDLVPLALREELPRMGSPDPIQNLSLADTIRLGEVLARSGYFKDARDASQAVVKILYGRELGIGAVTSLMGIHVIEGKPAPSANLLAALVKRSGRYNYRVLRLDDDACELAFQERGEEIGRSKFDTADAARAKLQDKDNWKRYPRAMRFARAMSEGVRTYMPDLLGGAPVYTPEELGVEVDESGHPLRPLPPSLSVDIETGELLPGHPVTGSPGHPVSHLETAPTYVATVLDSGGQDPRKLCHEYCQQLGWSRPFRPRFAAALGREIGELKTLTTEWAELEPILGKAVRDLRRCFAAYADLARGLGLDPGHREYRLDIAATLLGREKVGSFSDLNPAEITELADRITARTQEERAAQAGRTEEADVFSGE